MTGKHVEKIAEFLSGKMTIEEQKIFEGELASDKELLAVYNTYLSVETHMHNPAKFASEQSLKGSLAKLRFEYFKTSFETAAGLRGNAILTGDANTTEANSLHQQRRSSKYRVLWKLLAAACIGIIAWGVTWYFLDNRKTEQVAMVPKAQNDSVVNPKQGSSAAIKPGASKDTAKPEIEQVEIAGSPKINQSKIHRQRLFAKYFRPDKVPEDKDGPLEEAFDLYEHKNYKNAALAFESADLNSVTRGQETEMHLNSFYASYYKAISYMAENKFSKAIPDLKSLNITDSFFHAKVNWYLALAYIKMDSLPQAVKILETISKDPAAAEYKQDADELVGELAKTD